METWCFPPLPSSTAGGESVRSFWLSVWVSIISMQSYQERARRLFPGRDGEFLAALCLGWRLWVGRTHSIPSRGKASMREMSKAGRMVTFHFQICLLGHRLGLSVFQKKAHTHTCIYKHPLKTIWKFWVQGKGLVVWFKKPGTSVDESMNHSRDLLQRGSWQVSHRNYHGWQLTPFEALAKPIYFLLYTFVAHAWNHTEKKNKKTTTTKKPLLLAL